MLVTFEGGEGSGKSTMAAEVASLLRARGLEVLLTAEPGGTPLGAELRRVLLTAAGPRPLPLTEALLFAADRAEHVARVIVPALAAGSVVLCDRFSDSTFAYQSERMPLPTLRALDALSTGGLRPDLTVLLGVPVEVALGRVRARGSADRFDMMPEEFHERIAARYSRMAEAEPERFLVVGEGASGEDVAQEVLRRRAASTR